MSQSARDPTRPDPTRGWTGPVSNSGRPYVNSGLTSSVPAITTHPGFIFEQRWMHLRFLPTVAVGFGDRCSF